MTSFDIAVSLIYLAAAVAGSVFALYILRTSGRDRPSDPEGVRRFIESAPRYRPEQTAAE